MEIKVGRWTFGLDVEGLVKFLDNFSNEHLQNIADALNREMKIQLKGFGGTEVPQNWVDEFLAHTKWEMTVEDGVYNVDLQSDVVENLMDTTSESATRARVILWGTGEIWTKPRKETWHGSKTSESRPGTLEPSRAISEYRIEQFEHYGSGIMEIMLGYKEKLMEKFYKDLTEELTEVARTLFYIRRD